MKQRALGLQKSKLDGSEHIFSAAQESLPLPENYSYRKFLPRILDQGSRPICVPCSVSTYLNWRENLENGSKSNNNVNYEEIYAQKQIAGEGMTFKEAFSYLRHHGVSSKKGKLKIAEYAMVKSTYVLKVALFMNGPCVAALPVYNYEREFWNQRYGDQLEGYHAISIVGYDEEGFIIRNSWGTSFADKGYTKLLYKDANKLLEIWTIMG